jgi:hypothetical protein
MANRRSHKKLRAEARARMVRTGESYQRALQQILGEQERQRHFGELVPLDDFELTDFTYFGRPATLATWRMLGTHGAVLLSESVRHTMFWSKPLFGKRGGW